MARRLAVVDASVVIWLLAPIKARESVDVKQKRERIEETMRDFRKAFSFIIPAPAVAELCKHGSVDIALADAMKRFGGMHVEPFTYKDGSCAAEMLGPALRGRKSGVDVRSIIKYDCLIAAIAHRKDAPILTTNKRDFSRYLNEIRSSVEVVYVDEIPKKGQLRLIDFQPPESSADAGES